MAAFLSARAAALLARDTMDFPFDDFLHQIRKILIQPVFKHRLERFHNQVFHRAAIAEIQRRGMA